MGEAAAVALSRFLRSDGRLKGAIVIFRCQSDVCLYVRAFGGWYDSRSRLLRAFPCFFVSFGPILSQIRLMCA